MKPITLLRRARTLIANKSKWCTGAFARAKDGKDCLISIGEQFCALGALHYVSSLGVDEEAVTAYCSARKYLENAAQDLYHDKITAVNDTCGYEAVIGLYDNAITEAKETDNE